ncbi:hypothetical protein [uncultured Massilia sp.]|uniref:hypothetical protein n=1 Tax=uncultured Massilia sp. TaxID=169973 RepID=UPI0025D5AF30|nr:hypothetical protein [uncultured Massilia sp.]
MKYPVLALCGAVLLSGCASFDTPGPSGNMALASNGAVGYTGSRIARPNGPTSNVSIVDKKSFEQEMLANPAPLPLPFQ